MIAVLDDEQVRAREDQATAAVRQAEARARLAQHQIAVLEEQLRQSRLGVDQARADAEGRATRRRDGWPPPRRSSPGPGHPCAGKGPGGHGASVQKGLVAEQEAERARNNEEAQAAIVSAQRRLSRSGARRAGAAKANL